MCSMPTDTIALVSIWLNILYLKHVVPKSLN